MSSVKTSKKKLLTIFLALAMLFALSAPAYAADTFSITITNPAEDYAYDAYQIFSGDYANGILSNIAWGNGVDPTALLDALKLPASRTSTGIDFTACTDAASVADAISSATMTSAQTEALAKIINNNLSSTTSGSATAPNDAGNYVIGNLNGGYYMVVNSAAPEGANEARFMLQVVKDITVVPKADKPTVDKNIVDDGGNNPTDTKTISIGDTVHFEVKSAVPNMAGYTKYFFIVTDTLSKGLTYSGNNKLVIKVGSDTLTADTDYTVSSSKDADGVTTLKIVFKDFYNKYNARVNDEILITYDATLNEQANTGINPNTNGVTLSYSNDPSFVPKGDNEPDPQDPPIGVTPPSTNYVYTTSITIDKTDGNGDPLSGAEFTLTGTAMNVVVVVEEQFEVDTLGEYYKLKDGTYTLENPTGDETHDAVYDDVDTLYSKSTKTTIKGNGKTDVDVKATTVYGQVSFTGLGEGTYTLKESVTPAGYNTMDDIVFRIKADYNTANEPTFSIVDADGVAIAGFTVAGNGAISTTIQNLPGSALPVTGGIGTTLFYCFGAIFALGAGIMLVTKKRMENKGE